MTALNRQLVLIALVVGVLATFKVQAETQLRFGVYTSDKATTMVRQFRPMMGAIERDLAVRLGGPVRVSMQVAHSYEQGIADIVEGQVDFSRFGPASYVMATAQNPQIRLLAMENNKGSKRFKGLIIVRADSPVQQWSDLRGKRFAFGDPRSTIGRYLAQQQLMMNGVLAEDLAGYEYLGRHDAVARAVAAGDFDAGAVKSRTLRKSLAKGLPLRKLAEFENVTKPWIARAGLEPRLFAALQATLLALRDEKALAALGKDGFLPGSDDDYHFVREAMKASTAFHD